MAQQAKNDTVTEFKMPEIWSKEQVLAHQDKIKTHATDLSNMIHEDAVQCLIHAMTHREPSLMVRLVTDTLAKNKSVVYTAGLLAWMKYFSPLRLSGNSIKFTGKGADGKEQPFDIERAIATPFWDLVKQGEPELRPMFQQGPLGAINKAVKDFKAAVANTNEHGHPIDKNKPYFVGKHSAEMMTFMNNVAQLAAILPDDSTRDEVIAKKKQRDAVANAA